MKNNLNLKKYSELFFFLIFIQKVSALYPNRKNSFLSNFSKNSIVENILNEITIQWNFLRLSLGRKNMAFLATMHESTIIRTPSRRAPIPTVIYMACWYAWLLAFSRPTIESWWFSIKGIHVVNGGEGGVVPPPRYSRLTCKDYKL